MAFNMLEPDDERTEFVGIAGGKIVRKVNEDTPGAIMREIVKEGKPTGKYVYEIHYKSITGTITNIKTHLYEKDGRKLESLHIHLSNGPEVLILSILLADKYVKSLMNKLPLIDFTKAVRIAPYDFTPQNSNGKRYLGVSLSQDGVKIEGGYFITYENDTRHYAHGYPVIDFEPEMATDEDWKGYALQEKKFFRKAIAEIINPMIPSYKPQAQGKAEEQIFKPEAQAQPFEPKAEVLPPDDDLPF